MPDQRMLPAVTVPQSGFDLLKRYAAHEQISVSEAIRRLLQSSYDLRVFAGKGNIDEYFEIDSWGGDRKSNRGDTTD